MLDCHKSYGVLERISPVSEAEAVVGTGGDSTAQPCEDGNNNSSGQKCVQVSGKRTSPDSSSVSCLPPGMTLSSFLYTSH